MARLRKTIRQGKESLGPHPDDVRILARMKFGRSEWHKLNWYVQFSAKEIKQLSPGELMTLKEEVLALERTLIRENIQESGIPVHTDEEIKQIHQFIRDTLTELVNSGMVCLGPFQTMISISFWETSEWSGGKGNSLLPYHFARLLKQFSSSIRRCQNCKNIFVAPRTSAYHCSRVCQSRAASKALREKKKTSRVNANLSRARKHRTNL